MQYRFECEACDVICDEKSISNGQSRYTGNIEHTRHRTKTNKIQKHNTENENNEQHGPHKKLGVNSGAREGLEVTASYMTLVVLLI